MRCRPKNWHEFQHYRDRRPPWIKIHRSLLDDREFISLPPEARALLPLLWLLASEHPEGEFDGSIDELHFRTRLPRKELEVAMREILSTTLVERLQDASTMLAGCSQDDTESVSVLSSSLSGTSEKATPVPQAEESRFEEFWLAYGRKVEKKAAEAAWKSHVIAAGVDQGMVVAKARAVAAVTEEQYRKHPHRWIRGACWSDDLPPRANGRLGPQRRLFQETPVELRELTDDYKD